MAKDKAKSFPMLPINHWWALRERFTQSMPGVVTDNYLIWQPGKAAIQR